jgi:hypothetical protein
LEPNSQTMQKPIGGLLAQRFPQNYIKQLYKKGL